MSFNTFFGLAVLIAFGIGLFYLGQERQANIAKGELQQAIGQAQKVLMDQKQAEINDFIKRNSK